MRTDVAVLMTAAVGHTQGWALAVAASLILTSVFTGGIICHSHLPEEETDGLSSAGMCPRSLAS